MTVLMSEESVRTQMAHTTVRVHADMRAMAGRVHVSFQISKSLISLVLKLTISSEW